MKVTEEQYILLSDHQRIESILALMRNQWISDKGVRDRVSEAFVILDDISKELSNKYSVSDD